MTTHQRINQIAEELRAIYRRDNNAPRLIYEMIEREFPHPRKLWNDSPDNDRCIKGGWGLPATSTVNR